MQLTAFEESIAVRVPQAPPQAVLDALRNALATFCRFSTAWRSKLGSTTLIAEKASYDLAGKAEAPICALISVRIKATQAPVLPRSEEEMDATTPGWRLATGRLPTRYLAPDRPDAIRLYPIPTEESANDSLEVEAALYPGALTMEIPDWIGTMYRKEIVEGACGELWSMRGKPWTDLAAAKQAEADLLAAARKARVRMEKSNTRAPTTARFTSFDEL